MSSAGAGQAQEPAECGLEGHQGAERGRRHVTQREHLQCERDHWEQRASPSGPDEHSAVDMSCGLRDTHGGTGISELPRPSPLGLPWTDRVEEAVRRIARQTGESAFFSLKRGDETVCLLREDGSFPHSPTLMARSMPLVR